jgi:hypothetical protein
MEELLFMFMKDLVAICEQFNVYVFHELSSDFVTLSNADASLHKFFKMFIIYFVLINVWFQNFFLVFRIAYYIYALHS